MITFKYIWSKFPGGVVGDCYGDIFQIGSPGNVGSPVICGYNTGQHSEQRIFHHLLLSSNFYLLLILI